MPLESFSADEVSILQSRYEQSETVGFYPTYRLGYQAALTKSWRFGAAVWWTSHVRLEKNTTVDDFTVLVDEQDRPVEAQVEGAVNYKIPLTPTAKSVKEFQTYHPPVRYSLGLEKTWPRIFKWSTDIVIHGPGSNRDEERQKTNVTGSTAWEITALRKFPLRMGLDAFPDSRKPQTCDKLWVRQGEFLYFYGTTLGLGYRSGDWNLYGNVLYQKAVGRLDTTQNHATQTTKFSKISVQTVGASIGMTSSF